MPIQFRIQGQVDAEMRGFIERAVAAVEMKYLTLSGLTFPGAVAAWHGFVGDRH